MEEPLARYQHSTIFVGTLMLVLGGRTNTVGENVQLEVYETESSEWRKFNSLDESTADGEVRIGTAKVALN